MPGAVFDIQTDGHLLASGTESAFNNAGTLRKSAGTGLSQLFLLPVNSSGAVEVLIGTLELAGGGNSSGSFTVQAGATLTFSNGPHVLALASSITGAGQVHFASAGAGATVYIFGSYAITGGTTVALGTVFFFTSAPGQLGALTISGGSTAIFSDATADSLAESDGNLAGTATLTVTGLTTWSGGTMGGGGRTIAAGGLRLTSAFPKILDDRIIDNQADAVWSDGDLRGGGFRGGVINNLPGATFDIQAAGVAFDGPTFNNFGTLRKSAGAGTVSFNAVLNNTGTVELRVGTLTVTGNFIQTDGSTTLAGGTLSAAGGLSLLGGTLSGSGTIIGNVTNAASIIVGDATTLGTLTINGSYTQTSAGNLTLKLGGIASGQFDRLVVSNTAALAGTLTVRLVNGYSPASGDSLRVLTAGSLSGTFGVLAGDGPLFDPLYDTTGLALRRR